jgi:hypothetical protein
LRAFSRQFPELPDSYFDYIAGRISHEQLIHLYPSEWDAAVTETAMLELGSEHARDWLPPCSGIYAKALGTEWSSSAGRHAKHIRSWAGQEIVELPITTLLRITAIFCTENISAFWSSSNRSLS